MYLPTAVVAGRRSSSRGDDLPIDPDQAERSSHTARNGKHMGICF